MPLHIDWPNGRLWAENDPESELISGAWCNGAHITVTEPEPTPLLLAVHLWLLVANR
jgi:hypothetical protein